MHTDDNVGLYGEARKIINDGNFVIKDAVMNYSVGEYPELTLVMTVLPKTPFKFSWEDDTPTGIKKYNSSKFYANGFNDGIDETLNALDPVRIIYNPPATIVFWGNGDKTVVKCSKNEKFNKYHGFCAAVAKRLFENNSQVTKFVNSGIEETPVKKSKKSKETKKK